MWVCQGGAVRDSGQVSTYRLSLIQMLLGGRIWGVWHTCLAHYGTGHMTWHAASAMGIPDTRVTLNYSSAIIPIQC